MGNVLRAIILIQITLGLLACGKLGPNNTSYPSTASASFPLSVSSSTTSLQAGQSVQLFVTGGTLPYTYKVGSSFCTVGYTGYVTAGNGNGICIVNVSDFSGQTSQVMITVGTGTATATSCSSMLNNPYISIADISLTGIGNAHTTLTVTNASDCANWCGSLGALYCAWLPAAVSTESNVCASWTAAQRVTYYFNYQSSPSPADAGACTGGTLTYSGNWQLLTTVPTAGAAASAAASMYATCASITTFNAGGPCTTPSSICSVSGGTGLELYACQ